MSRVTTKRSEVIGRPWKDTAGTVHRSFTPKVRLLTPYVLVADRAARSLSGATHLATLFESDGVVDIDPMTTCGLSSGSRPQRMEWVKGPVRITCLRCTTIALLDLGRNGQLPGCER